MPSDKKTPGTRIPRFQAGRKTPSVHSASDMNVIVDALNSLNGFEIEGFDIVRSDGNWVAIKNDKTRAVGAGTLGTAFAQFLVMDVKADYLVCREYTKKADGTEVIGNGDFFIAKPEGLRATPFHNQLVDGLFYFYQSNFGWWDYRTVTIKSPPVFSNPDPAFIPGPLPFDEEWPIETKLEEKVWPPYIPEFSLIYAAKSDGKPLIVPRPTRADPDTGIEAEVDVEFVDVNADARSWQMIWRPVSICTVNADGSTSNKLILVRSSKPYDPPTT